MTAQVARAWEPVCSYDRLQPERGVAALVGGIQVALFRTVDGMLHAVDNQDPFSGQFVLSRGLTGSVGDARTIASPLHKQAFDLRTGVCVTDPAVSISVHDVRRNGDTVEVRLRS